MKKVSVKLLIIMSIIMFIVCFSGSLAYFNWSSNSNTIVSFKVKESIINIMYSGGYNISASLYPVSDKSYGIKTIAETIRVAIMVIIISILIPL